MPVNMANNNEAAIRLALTSDIPERLQLANAAIGHTDPDRAQVYFELASASDRPDLSESKVWLWKAAAFLSSDDRELFAKNRLHTRQVRTAMPQFVLLAGPYSKRAALHVSKVLARLHTVSNELVESPQRYDAKHVRQNSVKADVNLARGCVAAGKRN